MRFLLTLTMTLILLLVTTMALAQEVPPDVGILVTAIQSHAWPVVAGASILILVYLSKLPALGEVWGRIPKRYRPLVVALLGVLSGVANALVTKSPWLPALLSNVMAAMVAIGTDQTLTKPLGSTPSTTQIIPPAPKVPTISERG